MIQHFVPTMHSSAQRLVQILLQGPEYALCLKLQSANSYGRPIKHCLGTGSWYRRWRAPPVCRAVEDISVETGLSIVQGVRRCASSWCILHVIVYKLNNQRHSISTQMQTTALHNYECNTIGIHVMCCVVSWATILKL